MEINWKIISLVWIIALIIAYLDHTKISDRFVKKLLRKLDKRDPNEEIFIDPDERK